MYEPTRVCVFPQDLQLWEDLCSLEGRLGQRYLTHESEDSFWIKNGAEPHPLVKQEQEIRSATQNSSPPTTPHSDDNSPTSRRGVKFQNNKISNGSATPEQLVEEKVALGGPLYLLSSSEGPSPPQTNTPEAENASEEVIDDKEDFMSSLERRRYIQRRDEEIVQAEAHASRIGYKVSSV